MPNLYIIGGCNGAGKTTASFTVLPEILQCKEFVNADEIARGLSPFQPETVSFQAGRIMLGRIKELSKSKSDFAFETTLSTRSYVPFIKHAKEYGYTVLLIFFWLESVELAKGRVLERVKKGGHSIPPQIIERRYLRGLENFFKLYIIQCHSWIVYDNSGSEPLAVAKGDTNMVSRVYNDDIWAKINNPYE